MRLNNNNIFSLLWLKTFFLCFSFQGKIHLLNLSFSTFHFLKNFLTINDFLGLHSTIFFCFSFKPWRLNVFSFVSSICKRYQNTFLSANVFIKYTRATEECVLEKKKEKKKSGSLFKRGRFFILYALWARWIALV